MNYRLLSKLLGIVAWIIGGMMIFSLPWAHPALGRRKPLGAFEPTVAGFETDGFLALLASIAICAVVGGVLYWLGRESSDQMYRKEALAVVGLSWFLATALGGLPFYFHGTYRSASVRLLGDHDSPLVFEFDRFGWRHWSQRDPLSPDELQIIQALLNEQAKGLSKKDLKDVIAASDVDEPGLFEALKKRDPIWNAALISPEEERAPSDRAKNYRIRWIKMGASDCLFESQSGFSTTGATVIADLEDPVLVPHCILFWRSSMHFLGGLGIIVIFVAILGQGAAGKSLMRAEMPGPTKEGPTARMQHTAWLIAACYGGLNLALAVILFIFGLTPFDALCHAFGTMATGGFSTYNASVGHFNSAAVDYTIILFMVLAGTNFTLLYFLIMRQPGKLLKDFEWQTYIAILAGVTLLIVLIGLLHPYRSFDSIGNAIRFSLFQVVSIMTTTGYGTDDFNEWNSFGRGVLFLLMFVGGCAGSTGGGLKVIRHILFVKILRLEIEQSFHPNVVRPLRLGGHPVDDPSLRKNILAYFGLILIIFVFSWLFVITVEPDVTWGNAEHKLIDSASAVAAMLNNIGPGLGTVGATQNYSHFSPLSKILFTWLMMVGRLEIFAILVLFVPGFWRSR